MALVLRQNLAADVFSGGGLRDLLFCAVAAFTAAGTGGGDGAGATPREARNSLGS
jgi:hypothetical protein